MEVVVSRLTSKHGTMQGLLGQEPLCRQTHMSAASCHRRIREREREREDMAELFWYLSFILELLDVKSCILFSAKYILTLNYYYRFASYIYSNGDIIIIIGLVSLFNGISTFEGYLMPKPFS